LVVDYPFRIHYTSDGSGMQVELFFWADVQVAAVSLQLRNICEITC
jgi:hypothetical protein